MIPGTVAMLGAAANTAGGEMTLTYVGAATSTSDVITAPGGIASGDLAIYLDHAENSSTTLPTAVTPSGFTNFFNQTHTQTSSTTATRVMISYKILAGTETNITGMNGTGEDNKCLFVYRPSISITAVTPLTGASWKYQIGITSNPSSQTTTLAGKATPLIYLALVVGNSSNNFSTQSPAFNGTSTTTNARFGRKLYNSEPQNHTVDADDLGRTTLVSGYIQVN